jgi:hypothetical protein
MATRVIRKVKPAGGGDYTTLNAFDAAERRDLVAADEIAVAECYPGGNLVTLTAQLRVETGWTTGANNYVEYRNAPGHHALGSPYDTALPHCEWNIATSLFGLFVKIPDFRIKGLQLYSRGAAGRVFSTNVDAPSGHYRFEENLVISEGTQVAQFPSAIRLDPVNDGSGAGGGGANGNNRVFNNVVFFNTAPGTTDGPGIPFDQSGHVTKTDVSNNTFIIPTSTPGALGIIRNKHQVNGAILNNRNNYYKVTGSAFVYGTGMTAHASEVTSNGEAADPDRQNIAYDTKNFRNPSASHTTFDASNPGGSFLVSKGFNTMGFGVSRDVLGLSRGLPFDVGAYQLAGAAGGYWHYWRQFRRLLGARR